MNPYLFRASNVAEVNLSGDSCRQLTSVREQDFLEEMMTSMEQHQNRLKVHQRVLVEEHRTMQQQAECHLRQCLESALAPIEAHRSSLQKMHEAATSLSSRNDSLHDKDQILSLVGHRYMPFRLLCLHAWGIMHGVDYCNYLYRFILKPYSNSVEPLLLVTGPKISGLGKNTHGPSPPAPYHSYILQRPFAT